MAIAPHTPIVLDSGKYINGLNLLWVDAFEIDISAGSCRDSTDTNNIVVEDTLALSPYVPGPNGSDGTPITTNTNYAIYVIGDSTGRKQGASLSSSNLTSPHLPAGYDMFRRIGYYRSDAVLGDIKAFTQTGEGTSRWMYYFEPIVTGVTLGTAANYADGNLDDLGFGIPGIDSSGIANIKYSFAPNAIGDNFSMIPNSINGGGAVATVTAESGATIVGNLLCPWYKDTGMSYKRSAGTLTLHVQGYEDQLTN